MNIQRVKEKRWGVLEEIKAMVATAEKEERSLTADEREKRDKMMTDVQEMSNDIEQLEKLAEEEARNMKTGNPDPEKDKAEWRTLGEFVQAVASNPTDQRLRGRFIENRDQSLGVGSEGGFLVPEQFATDLLTVGPDEAIVRPRARIFTGGESDLHVPAIQYSGNNMYGGVSVNWIDEGAAKPATEAEFKRITLHAYEVAAHVPVTDKLLRNTSMIDTVVRDMLRGAIVNAEEDMFLNGAGGVQPTGVIGHASTVTVARTGAAAVVYADLVNMYQRFRGRRGVWVIARNVLSELMTLVDANGNLVWQPNARDGNPGTIFGFPVLISDNSPALGVTGDVLLADFSQYLVKDGAGITIAASPHVQFLNNTTVIKAFKTVDGTPWLTGELPTNPTTSPFVELEA